MFPFQMLANINIANANAHSLTPANIDVSKAS